MEEFVDDEGLRDTDRLSRRDTGRPYRDRERPRVTAWVRVARWHGWYASRPVAGDEDLGR